MPPDNNLRKHFNNISEKLNLLNNELNNIDSSITNFQNEIKACAKSGEELIEEELEELEEMNDDLSNQVKFLKNAANGVREAFGNFDVVLDLLGISQDFSSQSQSAQIEAGQNEESSLSEKKPLTDSHQPTKEKINSNQLIDNESSDISSSNLNFDALNTSSSSEASDNLNFDALNSSSSSKASDKLNFDVSL